MRSRPGLCAGRHTPKYGGPKPANVGRGIAIPAGRGAGTGRGEGLALPLERVQVKVLDTDATPFDSGLGAGRPVGQAG